MSDNPAEIASKEALRSVFSAIKNKQHFRLEAGAGAGKTYSLIHALNRLIRDSSDEFIKNSKQIACITYTNVAKDEINERTDNHPLIYSETIHAFCWNLLKGFQAQLRNEIYQLSERWIQRIKESEGIQYQKVVYDLGYPKIDEFQISLHHDDVIKLMVLFLAKSKFRLMLQSKFPIIFIDEYQDTNKELAAAIVKYLVDQDSGVLIGFFGDHWQKIYGSNACGLIKSSKSNILEIGKKVNFRSDKNIVACLNRLRPELPQIEADPKSNGEITVYHSNNWVGDRRAGGPGGHWKGDLPQDESQRYFERVKKSLVSQGWNFNEGDSKVLFLTNNAIATEQGFKELADCFRDTDDYLKKGDHYIKFFCDIVEPVCEAFQLKNYGKLFSVLNKKELQLTKQADKKIWIDMLTNLNLLRETGTVGDVISMLKEQKRPRLSPKVEQLERRFNQLQSIEDEDCTDSELRLKNKIKNLKEVKYSEVIKLVDYINDKTPFSTKHGVKGAQFDNVLIVLGRGWNHYNWDQLFVWLKDGFPKDKTDTFERNRNLFYVACSRAKKRMSLLITQELSQNALDELSYIFGKNNIIGDPLN